MTPTSGSGDSRFVPASSTSSWRSPGDPGVVLTRDALLEDVWGTDFPGETRTVDVHVAELRKALAPDGPEIETARGYGYRMVPPARAPLPTSGAEAAE